MINFNFVRKLHSSLMSTDGSHFLLLLCALKTLAWTVEILDAAFHHCGFGGIFNSSSSILELTTLYFWTTNSTESFASIQNPSLSIC